MSIYLYEAHMVANMRRIRHSFSYSWLMDGFTMGARGCHPRKNFASLLKLLQPSQKKQMVKDSVIEKTAIL